jgi:hypothetical protein
MPKMIFTEEFFAFFFHISEDFDYNGKTRNIFNCKCEVVAGKMCHSTTKPFSVIKGSSKSKLSKHLEECVPDYEEIYNNRAKPKTLEGNEGDFWDD